MTPEQLKISLRATELFFVVAMYSARDICRGKITATDKEQVIEFLMMARNAFEGAHARAEELSAGRMSFAPGKMAVCGDCVAATYHEAAAAWVWGVASGIVRAMKRRGDTISWYPQSPAEVDPKRWQSVVKQWDRIAANVAETKIPQVQTALAKLTQESRAAVAVARKEAREPEQAKAGKVKPAKPKKATISMRMLALLSDKVMGAVCRGWTALQWAQHLKVTEAGVKWCKTWKDLQARRPHRARARRYGTEAELHDAIDRDG